MKFSRPLAPSQIATVATTTSHNTFLTVLAELGAVGEGPWAVVGDQRRLLAVYEPNDDAWLKPAVVLVTSQ